VGEGEGDTDEIIDGDAEGLTLSDIDATIEGDMEGEIEGEPASILKAARIICPVPELGCSVEYLIW